MSLESLHLSLSNEQMALLAHLASARSVSTDVLAGQAVSHYLAMQAAWEKGVVEGIAQLDAGQRVSLEEAFAPYSEEHKA